MKRHGFQEFMVRRNLRIGLGSWCHWVAVRRNLNFQSYRECRDKFPPVPGLNAKALDTKALGFPRPLMGPGLAAPECKIVGVSGLPAYMRLGFNELVGNPLTLAIGDSVFLGVEAKGELLLH